MTSDMSPGRGRWALAFATMIAACAAIMWPYSADPGDSVHPMVEAPRSTRADQDVGETISHASDRADGAPGRGYERVPVIQGGRAQAPSGAVQVLSADRTPVRGASVVLGRGQGVSWIVAETHTTGGDGIAYLSAPMSGPVDVSVHASEHVPWFGRGALDHGRDKITVVMSAGLTVAGRVESHVGPLAGVRVRVVGRLGAPWPLAEFFANTMLPSEAMGVLPPGDATYGLEAVTDSRGEFAVKGLDPRWNCVALVDDEAWVMNPVGVRVTPGDSGVILRVEAATGVDVLLDGREPASLMGLSRDNPVNVHVLVQHVQSGESRSFGLQAEGRSTRLRFTAPAHWHGSLDCRATVHGKGTVDSSGGCRGEVGSVASLSIRIGAQDQVRGRVLDVIAQWPDGTLCTNGIVVVGRDDGGAPIRVDHVSRIGSGYRILVDERVRRLHVLATECFRDWSEAGSIDVAALPPGGIAAVTMPSGADLLLVTPGIDAVNVVLLGPFGAKALDVQGMLRLRSLAPGKFVGKCTIEDAPREVSVEVAAAGEFRLDFTR